MKALILTIVLFGLNASADTRDDLVRAMRQLDRAQTILDDARYNVQQALNKMESGPYWECSFIIPGKGGGIFKGVGTSQEQAKAEAYSLCLDDEHNRRFCAVWKDKPEQYNCLQRQ